MEKESITELMLDPDSFYGAVSEALDRFKEPDLQNVEFLAVVSSVDFAMKHYRTLADGKPLAERLSELCRAHGFISQPEVSGHPQFSAHDLVISPKGDLCACMDYRTVTILVAGEMRPIVSIRIDLLDEHFLDEWRYRLGGYLSFPDSETLNIGRMSWSIRNWKKVPLASDNFDRGRLENVPRGWEAVLLSANGDVQLQTRERGGMFGRREYGMLSHSDMSFKKYEWPEITAEDVRAAAVSNGRAVILAGGRLTSYRISKDVLRRSRTAVVEDRVSDGIVVSSNDGRYMVVSNGLKDDDGSERALLRMMDASTGSMVRYNLKGTEGQLYSSPSMRMNERLRCVTYGGGRYVALEDDSGRIEAWNVSTGANYPKNEERCLKGRILAHGEDSVTVAHCPDGIVCTGIRDYDLLLRPSGEERAVNVPFAPV
ncbi:MAG: hypothetical protein J5674_04110 [Candidatus Methanomethylophilaceae archaeon]|nr:hypothetical protein [Candidatus Methanomethylophilaceae archaeon]